MPHKRKDSPIWWASFTNQLGKRVRRSTGTKDRREAAALEAKWKLEAFKEKAWGEQPDHSFEEMMVIYLEAKRHEKRPLGFRRDQDATRHLLTYFRGYSARLDARAIGGYKRVRLEVGVTPSTINRELCVLSAAINYTRRELDWDIPNPVTGRKLRTDDSRDRHLSETEVALLAQAAKREPNAPHLSDFIALALHTGCRKGELLGLEWSRVNLEGRYFHLGGSDTKTGKRRSIPINETAMKALLSRSRFRSTHCPDSPWVFCHANGSQLKDVKRAFATACRRVGIENFRIHDLRHTFAARLVSRHRPLTEVRDLLGHTTIKMTERYAHLAPENLRLAVNCLDDGG